MRFNKVLIFILFIFTLFTCDDDHYFPKPKSYLRINFPTKEYYAIDNNCPFTFKIPNYSAWVKKFNDNQPCNKAIIYPDFKAEVLCDYMTINDNLYEVSEDFRKMVYKHSFKSNAIIERVWENDSNKVYGLAYEIKGNTACNYAFTLTDSNRHFFSGQLLFQIKPNYDSLKPSIEFLQKDIEAMIASFKWAD